MVSQVPGVVAPCRNHAVVDGHACLSCFTPVGFPRRDYLLMRSTSPFLWDSSMHQDPFDSRCQQWPCSTPLPTWQSSRYALSVKSHVLCIPLESCLIPRPGIGGAALQGTEACTFPACRLSWLTWLAVVVLLTVEYGMAARKARRVAAAADAKPTNASADVEEAHAKQAAAGEKEQEDAAGSEVAAEADDVAAGAK